MEWNNERGSALLLTIIVAVILLFLGGSLGVLAVVESRMAQREEAAMQAYYLARSGADAMAQYIIDHPTELSEDMLDRDSEPVLFNSNAEDRFFTVLVMKDSSGAIVRSTGVVGEQKRVVELMLVTQSVAPPFDYAIVGMGGGSSKSPSIKLTGSASIHGDTATNSVGADSIVFEGNTHIYGNLSVGLGADPDSVVKACEGCGVNGVEDSLTMKVEYPPIIFPDFPTDLPPQDNFDTPEDKQYDIDTDGHWDIIKNTSYNRTIRIDLQGGTRKIRVRHLDLGAHIELINVGENGRLLLYVDEKITHTSGGLNINFTGEGKDRPEAFTIYYAGSSPFWNNQFKMTGNIVSEIADVVISQGCELRGNIFTNGSRVEISGGANAAKGLVYAPNAMVTLAGSGVTGVVVSDKFEASGSASVVYPHDRRFEETFPEGIFDPGTGGGSGGVGYARGAWSSAK